MMYPVAVEGKMPFVDHKSYREQQINKVIQKHRAKRQRDSMVEKYSLEKSKTFSKNSGAHPSLCRVNSPRFILDDSSNILDDNKTNNELTPVVKRNILHAIKRFFSSTKDSSKSAETIQSKPYQPKFEQKSARNGRPHSAPLDIRRSRKTQLNSNSPPGVSPKRQRRRTVSNIGSIMETIEEIPEGFVLADEPDSDLSSSHSVASSGSSESLDSALEGASGQASLVSSTEDLILGNSSDLLPNA